MTTRPVNVSPRQLIASSAAAVAFAALAGCELDSFFDPSKTGYFQQSPITTPILERIDVVERADDPWADASPVTPPDLLPSDLEYRLAAGDLILVEVMDLLVGGDLAQLARRIDQAGNVRLPRPLGDFPAAGLTPAELEDALADFLDPEYIVDPFVSVTVNEGRGFTYTVIGNIQLPGLFPVTRPDLRLDQALAQSGGVPATTERIFIIRPVALDPGYEQPFEREGGVTPPQQDQPTRTIDDILRDLDQPGGGGGGGAGDGGSAGGEALRMDGEAQFVDIDDVASAAEPSAGANARSALNVSPGSMRNDTFVFVEARNEWVPVPQEAAGQDIADEYLADDTQPVVLERVIEVDYQRLIKDNSQNVVIRPGDRIYVEPPAIGVVYIEGEVGRVGVYSLPQAGRQTLSRLVAAAGGLAPLAIPARVDLIRRIGDNREATIRVNLGAIRKRTEPDIFLKPDDHIIVGTNFVAGPLAVFRGGFRASYGYGFILDRNFGNDVFGAPPRSGVQ